MKLSSLCTYTLTQQSQHSLLLANLPEKPVQRWLACSSPHVVRHNETFYTFYYGPQVKTYINRTKSQLHWLAPRILHHSEPFESSPNGLHIRFLCTQTFLATLSQPHQIFLTSSEDTSSSSSSSYTLAQLITSTHSHHGWLVLEKEEDISQWNWHLISTFNHHQLSCLPAGKTNWCYTQFYSASWGNTRQLTQQAASWHGR